MTIKLARRGFITGLVSFAAAAPAIVRASSLMPVKAIVYPQLTVYGRSLCMDALADISQLVTQTICYGNAEYMPMRFTGFVPFYDSSDEAVVTVRG